MIGLSVVVNAAIWMLEGLQNPNHGMWYHDKKKFTRRHYMSHNYHRTILYVG